MTPKLKICGLTNLNDARFAAGAGADFAGFIQYSGSPRYVDPATAKEIIEWLYGAAPVGVFVDADPAEINRIADDAGFAYVQLHGDETPADCAAIEKPVIKAFRIRPEHDADAVRALVAPYHECADYFLFDTYHADAYGGTGQTFNWAAVAPLADEFDFFLAGGITTDNVAEAVETVQPFAIDLSSSVEETPGVKDFDKLGDFFDVWDTVAPTEDPA